MSDAEESATEQNEEPFVSLGIWKLAWLGLPVEWVFAALIGDYIVKAALLVGRFRGDRWQRALAKSTGSAR
jgi:Na+-driven multidrug efflux pump